MKQILLGCVFMAVMASIFFGSWYATPVVHKQHGTGGCVRVYALDTTTTCMEVPVKHRTVWVWM